MNFEFETKATKINGFSFYSYPKDDKSLKQVTIQDVLINNINNNLKLFKSGVASWGLVNEDKILDLINKNRYFCEVLATYPKKVYFDIDGKDKDGLTLEIIKNIINKYFNNPKMAISGYETDKKKSYHIILPEIILENNDDLMLLKTIVKLMKEENEYFDDRVYTKNRAMKSIKQSKPHGIVQDVMENDNLKDHFICSFLTGTEQKINYELTEDVKIPINKNLHLKKDIPLLKLKLDKEFNIEDLKDSLKLLNMTPHLDHAHTWKVALFCASNGITFDQFWEWASKKENNDIRRAKWAKYYDYIITNNKYALCKKSFIKYLSHFYPELVNKQDKMDISTKIFLDSFLFHQDMIDRIKMEHYNTKEKAVIYNLAMGGGKTTATIQYLKESKSSFVWVAPRVALVENTSSRLIEEGEIKDLVKYNDKTNSKSNLINSNNKLIIQAESLHYINKENKYDTLVIDEIETVLNTWDSNTHGKNIAKNFDTFKHLFLSAKKIILLDAFITKKTLNFLDNLHINYKIYGSLYKPQEKLLIENQNMSSMISKIVNDLKANKKIFIFYCYANGNDKKYNIEELKKKIQSELDDEKEIFTMYGKQTDKLKKEYTQQVNQKWNELDAIITTSSVTVGINYDDNKYDKVYLFIDPLVNLARDILQTSMRIRKPKENNIDLYFFNKQKRDVYEYPIYYLTNNDDIYKKLIDDLSVEKEATFIDSFFKLCNITNYNCNNIKRGINTKREKINNEYFEEQITKKIISYNNIPKIDDFDKENIEKKIYNYEADVLDKYIIDKYYFDIKFKNFNEDDKAFIFNYSFEKFFKHIHHPLIMKVLDDNNITRLIDLDLNNIIISDETQEYLNKHFKTSNLKKNNLKIIKTINHILGAIIDFKVVSKNYTYFFTDDFEELFGIYESYKTVDAFINDDDTDITIIKEEEVKPKVDANKKTKSNKKFVSY
jgi:hypothetical protein